MTFLLSKERQADVADALAVALAASLPISTSATSILAVLWLLAMIPTLRWVELRVELARPHSLLPLLLVGLGFVGTMWADIGWRERVEGLDSFVKLLVIPFLAIQFSKSKRGYWVMLGFLAACVVAWVLSIVAIIEPKFHWRGDQLFPVPFKNQATQSGEFVICIGILLYCAIDWWRDRKLSWSIAALVICAAFLWMTAYSATGRTPLVTAPILIVLLAFRQFSFRGAIVFIAGAAVIATALFYASPYLQERVEAVRGEIARYTADESRSSTGERLDFWKKSLVSISKAPLLGHGTGSVAQQMAEQTKGQTGPYAVVTHNPHQQTLAVAIQLGLAGALLLWVMWIVHGAGFRGGGLAAWIGMVIVVQNVVGSLFNSHLFDFTQGWIYVVGVGVAAGMVDRAKNGMSA